MSYARPTHAGTTYMITRRCSERRFFLQPTPLVAQVFAYLVAVAAERSGVLVHAVCVLSNHYHAVVTDPDQRIPEFYHYLHEFSTKCLNASRGRWEAMWASEETNRLALEDLAAVVDKVEYTLCNPVSSHLVETASLWPGLRMWWADEAIVVDRPDVFFLPNGDMPEEVTLRLVPPPVLEAADDDGGIERITAGLARREAKIRRRAHLLGRRFLGLENLGDQHWSESPASFAKRRGLRPRIATRNKWRRLEAIARDRSFVAAHADCRVQWLAGNRDVLWPAGTYQMRVRHNVRCAQAPPR